MAIIAVSFDIAAGMFELLPSGRDLVQLGATALRQDSVTGIAIIGFDGTLAVGSLVQAVVAPEAARPVFMADVVGIDIPTRLHLGEEVVRIDLLHGGNRRPDARVVRITLDKVVAMLCNACVSLV